MAMLKPTRAELQIYMAAQISTYPAERSTDLPVFGTSAGLLSAVPAWLSVALVPFVALAAGTGLLVPGVYRDAPTWVSQARGQDLVTLLVGAPLLVAGLIGARRGSARCLLLWLGAVGYMAYAYATYAFATHFNPLFLVYVLNFGLSVYALMFGLIRLDAGRLRTAFSPHAPTRLVSASLVGMGLLVALLWLGQDVPALLAGQVPGDIAEAGLLTNPIHVLDLALVLPAAILTGVLLARRRPWGYVLGAYFLVKFTTLGLAIMSMSVFMVADGQSLSVPLVVVFAVWTVVSALLAWRFLSTVGAPARPFGHLKEASR
jgi:hypothetical protein